MKPVIFNCAIITTEGEYTYTKSTLIDVKRIITSGFDSAVRHAATAVVLSDLFGTDVPMNRIKYIQQPGQVAIVFQMRDRIPEGKILSREEIEKIGYDFFILKRK